MRIFKSDDGAFDFEYQPGESCTAYLFAPLINLYKPVSKYFEDNFSEFFRLLHSEFQSCLEANGLTANDNVVFAPIYKHHYKPGIWPRNTLFLMMEEAANNDDYETAAQIKNELTLFPFGPIALDKVNVDFKGLRPI